MEAVRIGVVGAGDISPLYLNAIDRSPALELRRIASRRPERAQELAARFGALGGCVTELLEDPSIELVINLTPAVAHEAVNAAAIAAGKHVYSEKPFALSVQAATALAESASRAGLLVGSAPDTFYGSAHQAARRALDSRAIGRPVFGTSFIGLPGLELFHPNPAAFYRPGGEPPFDIGPYYIAMWINLLGPVRRVVASSGAGRDERTILRGPRAGERFAVEVDTSFVTVLEFDLACVSLVISLDVVQPMLKPGELYGADGILALSDPLFFSGDVAVTKSGGHRAPVDAEGLAFAAPNRRDHLGRPVADYRGVVLVDLALAIRTGRRNRTAADFIVHASEVMEAMVLAARERRSVTLQTDCARPAVLDPIADAELIACTASPFDADAVQLEHAH